MILLDGKKARDEIAKKLADRIAGFKNKPKLVIIQVGNLEESNAYIEQKKKLGEEIGCNVLHRKFTENISETEIISAIKKFNTDKTVNGIIVQLPIPKNLDKEKITETILPEKDVDGMHSANQKLLWEGKAGGFVPATAKGVISLLDFYKIPIEGGKAVVIGRSALVGKPIALSLLNRNATVTVCHRKTADLSQEIKNAVIVVSAAGKPNLIGKNDVMSGQVIVDVGINLVGGKKLNDEIPKRKIVGDVSFDEVKDIVAAISPVPGGVGPMTVVSLFGNLADAYEKQNS